MKLGLNDMAAEAVKLRLRPIIEEDRDGVVNLLGEGFARRSVTYWRRAWNRLIALDKPDGFSQLGYVIDLGGEIVGVILIVAARNLSVEGSNKRANLSSWYVQPKYRSYAAMLLSRACKEKDITFLNVSAAQHTYAICEALGFVRYSEGQIAAIPLLSQRIIGLSIKPYSPLSSGLSAVEEHIMADHLDYGCVCLVGNDTDSAHPFVFVKRYIKGFLPTAQLIYCRSTVELARYAQHIGAYLAVRGIFFLILDASSPIAGLIGKYYPGRSPKYYKGSKAPQIGDLAYTEIAIFGI
jgi:hypothetical protein